MAGKGSGRRKGANQKAYEDNWENIFGKCKVCGKPHGGTGFQVDHPELGFIRVCDICGIELRNELIKDQNGKETT